MSVPTFIVSLSLLCCFMFGNKLFDINHELFIKLSLSPEFFSGNASILFSFNSDIDQNVFKPLDHKVGLDLKENDKILIVFKFFH